MAVWSEQTGVGMDEFSSEPRSDLLRAAFDPEAFRDLGHRVVDLLADRLHSNLAGEGRVRLSASPDEEFAYWAGIMNEAGGDELELLDRFVARSIQLHHPGYVGHQVCAPAPGAAVAGLVAELLNNGMAVYEMGPAATALERWVVEQTGKLVGFKDPSGFLTSGGTLAMLTALLAARSRSHLQSGGDVHSPGRFAVLASTEAHYCASRAAQVMGWGEDGIVRIPVDRLYKMRVDLLENAFERALSSGRSLSPWWEVPAARQQAPMTIFMRLPIFVKSTHSGFMSTVPMGERRHFVRSFGTDLPGQSVRIR